MNVESDVRALLISTVTSCSSLNTFIGPFRKLTAGRIPAPSVFIQEYSYTSPTPYMDSKEFLPLRNTSCHIKIRGGPQAYVNTKALAEAIWVACDRPSMTSSSSIHYVSVLPQASGVMYIGTNDVEGDEFVVNINIAHGAVAKLP